MEHEGHDEFVQGFRGVMGQLPTSVSVVIAMVEGCPRALTVGSVILASLDPPLLAVFVARKSPMHGHLLMANRFTISVLDQGDPLIARRFARSESALEWNGLDPSEVEERVSGPPVLRGAVSWLDCQLDQAVVVGDHSCFVGKVLGMDRRLGAKPLVYYRGRFHALGADVSPGMRLTVDSGELLSSW